MRTFGNLKRVSRAETQYGSKGIGDFAEQGISAGGFHCEDQNPDRQSVCAGGGKAGLR